MANQLEAVKWGRHSCLQPALSRPPGLTSPPPLDLPFWLSVLACIAALFCAINTSTLWIDEGFSTFIAAHRTFSSALHTLAIGDASDRQMPLHYLWLWGWVRVFGSSEYALRAANLPCAALFVLSLALTSRAVFERRFAWLPLAFAPFAWFYLNETRAYFMLLAFSAAATGAALAWSFAAGAARDRAPAILLAALLGAALTHMLAGLLLPALAVIIAAGFYHGREFLWRPWIWPLAVYGIPLVILAAFYAGTLSKVTAYDYGQPTLLFFGSALYDHAGFGGLGPPRNVLRTATIDSFAPYAAWLGVGAVVVAVVLASGFRRPIDRRFRWLAAGWILSMALAVTAAYLVNSRFLGRHIAALFPLLLFSMMAARPNRRVWLALALVWGTSDLRLSLMPAYAKEDYRAAVRELIERSRQRPGLIAWAADPLTANYYGLALEDPKAHAGYQFDYTREVQNVDWPVRARGVVVQNWDAGDAAELLRGARRMGRPLYLALSKPDLYDGHDVWQKSVRSEHATLVASLRQFSIFSFE